MRSCAGHASSPPRQRKAQHHGGDGLGRRFLAHAHEAAEGQQLHGEELGRTELERELRQQRRQEGDQQHREHGAHEARREGRRQRLRRAALLRHRVAVEGGGHAPGFARDVEQDRRDRPAEQRTPVDAAQHDDGRGGVHAERQRQQDGHAVGATQPGQHADQHTQRDADQHEAEVGQRQRNAEALQQVLNFVHGG
jgi:hypothetical protein